MMAPSKAKPSGEIPTVNVPRFLPSLARSLLTLLLLIFATQMLAPSKATLTGEACGHAVLLIPVCADGAEGCGDAPLGPAVITRSRAASGAAPKTMTAEELAKFKERIARMAGRNRGFGFWPRR